MSSDAAGDGGRGTKRRRSGPSPPGPGTNRGSG